MKTQQRNAFEKPRGLELAGHTHARVGRFAFRGETLLAAYAAAAVVGYEAQDTAAIVRRFADVDIAGVPGESGNLKVTVTGDLDLVRSGLETSRIEPR